MNLSMKWLADFTDVSDVAIKDYCDKLTLTGSKVEGYTEMGAEIENVVVARIISLEPHPDSDHLIGHHFLHNLQSDEIMLASTYNIVAFRETDCVVVMRFSALEVNGQRTTVNSLWVCITNAHCLLSLVRKNPVDKVCCPLSVVCCL